MKPKDLVQRGLTHYWRTNVAVVLGVATAVTVLAGALLVGDSVRGSLRDLVLQRLGRVTAVVTSTGFFRERLADDLRADAAFGATLADICPIVVVQGLATDQRSGRRSLGVQVYGVDDRFWRFHGVGSETKRTPDAGARDVLLSPALARDLGAEAGATILLRIQRPSAIPLESLHGRKDDPGRTLRLTLQGVLDPADLGEFSLRPQQGDVRAAFVPLARLQQELDLAGRVNTLLISTTASPRDRIALESLETLFRSHVQLDDLGLQLRRLEPQGVLSLEANGTVIDAPRADAASAAATAMNLRSTPVFTYLVDRIRKGGSADAAATIPYSLVSAIDLQRITTEVPSQSSVARGAPPIVLNEWAARDLRAAVGDPITLDYLVWEDPGVLRPRSATFQLAAIEPIAGVAADRDLVPLYPGITDSENLRDWDPPFPIDLRRVRPADEAYWREYRTTPKAFIPLDVGQSLWQTRHGSLTSIRLVPPPGVPLSQAGERFSTELRNRIDPFSTGFSAHDARAEGLAASRGATDFGEYFTYFSFFLVAAALLLAVLFFKLGVEQRGREVGLLRAVGFTTASVRRLFTAEGLVLSVVGSALGVIGAIGYGYLMMAGLRTWWVDAVGTTALTLHISITSLAAGAAGGIVGAIGSIWWTLRSLRHVSERSLLAGQLSQDPGGQTGSEGYAARRGHVRTRRPDVSRIFAIVFLAVGAGLIAGTFMGRVDSTAAFFGAGTSLLVSCLAWLAVVLRARSRTRLTGQGRWPLVRLGWRNAGYRPARSIVAIAVMASATFVLISVGAFRRDAATTSTDPHSGTGGYALLVNTLLPVVHDPNSSEGRALLGLSDFPEVAVTPLRVRPGDDTSCLNLYEPRQPRIMAVGSSFIDAGRFAFQSSLALTDEERMNPWRLLEQPRDREAGGAIPVIADANSMTYILHKSLGDEIVVMRGHEPLRLRLVAALADSIFQGELLMSDANFTALFPDQPGYQFLLVDAPGEQVNEVSTAIEDRLSDFGADAVPSAQRLAEFHKVENTYLSTFQTLGGLGLLLGTIGLAAVLLRNVLERRRELALLGAIGYRREHIITIVMAEHVFLLIAGLATGAVCAALAIAPAAMERGGRLPGGAGAWLLLCAVFAAGLISSLIATRVTLRTRLLNALKAE